MTFIHGQASVSLWLDGNNSNFQQEIRHSVELHAGNVGGGGAQCTRQHRYMVFPMCKHLQSMTSVKRVSLSLPHPIITHTLYYPGEICAWICLHSPFKKIKLTPWVAHNHTSSVPGLKGHTKKDALRCLGRPPKASVRAVWL